MVAAGAIEQSIGFSTAEAAEQNGLAELAGLAGEVPLPDTHNVHAMLPLWHLIQRLQNCNKQQNEIQLCMVLTPCCPSGTSCNASRRAQHGTVQNSSTRRPHHATPLPPRLVLPELRASIRFNQTHMLQHTVPPFDTTCSTSCGKQNTTSLSRTDLPRTPKGNDAKAVFADKLTTYVYAVPIQSVLHLFTDTTICTLLLLDIS